MSSGPWDEAARVRMAGLGPMLCATFSLDAQKAAKIDLGHQHLPWQHHSYIVFKSYLPMLCGHWKATWSNPFFVCWHFMFHSLTPFDARFTAWRSQNNQAQTNLALFLDLKRGVISESSLRYVIRVKFNLFCSQNNQRIWANHIWNLY